MAQIIDGRLVAEQVKSVVKEKIDQRLSDNLRPPGLAVVLVGDDPASEVYVRNKRKTCDALGVKSISHNLSSDVGQAELLALVDALNNDETVDGILVQLPLPSQIDANVVLETIRPDKDVDGFHPYNIGRLAVRMPTLRPCTPYGVMKLLESTGEAIRGKHAVVVGASNIVGRPMGLELLLAGCTVTSCHRFTEDLASFVKQADIVVVGVGIPDLVKGAWIKPGAIVIDVGMNRLESGKLAGDVEYLPAAERAGWITPVPGGVGPMTIAMLMQNTLYALETFHS